MKKCTFVATLLLSLLIGQPDGASAKVSGPTFESLQRTFASKGDAGQDAFNNKIHGTAITWWGVVESMDSNLFSTSYEVEFAVGSGSNRAALEEVDVDAETAAKIEEATKAGLVTRINFSANISHFFMHDGRAYPSLKKIKAISLAAVSSSDSRRYESSYEP